MHQYSPSISVFEGGEFVPCTTTDINSVCYCIRSGEKDKYGSPNTLHNLLKTDHWKIWSTLSDPHRSMVFYLSFKITLQQCAKWQNVT